MTAISPLYEGQSKAESTVVFLLQTEVLRLNIQLASIYVPQTTPHYIYKWPTQTVHHVLLFCNYHTARDQLLTKADTSNITQMLSTSRGLHAAAQWLISQKVLQQFQTAHKIQQKDTKKYTNKPEPLPNPFITPQIFQDTLEAQYERHSKCK